MAVSRVTDELAKKERIAQWDRQRELKQDFLDGLHEYVKHCSEMTPKLKVCKYLQNLVGKTPNEENEKEWKKEAGLDAYDCGSSRSSRASSRSSGISLTPAKRRQIADQLPMAVDTSYPYYAEMQPPMQPGVWDGVPKEASKEVISDDVKRSVEQILGKMDEFGDILKSLNGRVRDLENF